MSDDDPERQRGRQRPQPTQRFDDWTQDEYEDAGRLATLGHKYKVRRRKKKARIAAMTRGRRIARRILVIGTWLLGALAALMVVAIVLFYTLTDVPRPEDLSLPQVATIEYADGSTLADFGTVDRSVIHLEQVPAHVRWAVLAAEDRGFYDEGAISVTGTLRAALSNITGGNTQGGSGITQQYVKNAYLSSAQTITRKLKELMIAVKLSREYSKDQILEFYLNTVYFGRNTYGIQAAAQAYFHEDVEKLTVAQGALLAGVLRAPGYYDPRENLAAATDRWHYVLDGMVTTHKLSAADAAAQKFPATEPISSKGLGPTGWKYLLVQRVLAELQAHGIDKDEIQQRGLQIRTTIDKRAQKAALGAIRTTFKGLTPQQRNLKNALVAVDPASGGILAYYGGTGPEAKGYDGKEDFNDYAGLGVRPPGSSFKPYTLATVLTQTLEQTVGKAHYAINSQVDGSYCRKIEGTRICNDPSDRTVSAKSIKIANAMKYSLNTTFDLLASQAGPSDVATTAHAMGIPKTDANGNKLLVNSQGATTFGIGIGDYPVSVQDQASGFATLASGGTYRAPYFVQSAVASDGETVYSHTKSDHRAIDKRVANDVTLTLQPIAGYSGDGLDGGRISAAKTGTEGLPGENQTGNSDAWMVGFTPQVSAAVWVGSGKTAPIYDSNGKPLYGANLPGRTWKAFMDAYLDGKPKLTMAREQMIDTDGGVPAPTPTPSPTPTTTAPSTDTPTPTPTPSTSSDTPTPTPTPSDTGLPTPSLSLSPSLPEPDVPQPGHRPAHVHPAPGG